MPTLQRLADNGLSSDREVKQQTATKQREADDHV
jgi:hypothetical protein